MRNKQIIDRLQNEYLIYERRAATERDNVQANEYYYRAKLLREAENIITKYGEGNGNG